MTSKARLGLQIAHQSKPYRLAADLMSGQRLLGRRKKRDIDGGVDGDYKTRRQSRRMP